MTVGSGFAPDLLTPRNIARALAGSLALPFGSAGIPPVGNRTPP